MIATFNFGLVWGFKQNTMRLIRDLNPESQKMLERIYRASKHHQVAE